MGKVTVEYCGVEASGRTLTQARQAAAREAEKRLSGDYTPAVVQRRGLAYLVWREPGSGWCTGCILDDASNWYEAGPRCKGTHQIADRLEVIARTMLHVCQQTWHEADGDALPVELTALRGPANILRDIVSEWRSWVKWQARFVAAQRAGLADNDAHSFAGRNPALSANWVAGGEWDRLEAECIAAGL